MIYSKTMLTAEDNDSALVAATLSGDRDAFARIIRRYQSLICSLAYSATGSLSQSEDLAQETFVTAWSELKKLSDPQKLRSWLCGIARNVISNSCRRDQREPVSGAEPIDLAYGLPSAETPTPDGVIRREEEAILWRSLARIPDTYREPLILFYRQGESVECVARQLELSEDAVKQRLLRGRKFLADEVTAFVEGALKQSAPGRAFTVGVLASLPVFAASASAATVGAGAVKGSAVASFSTAAAISGILLGPIIGLVGAYLGVKASINATRTPRERAFVVRQTKVVMVATVAFNLVLFGYIFAAINLWKRFPIVLGVTGVLIPLVFGFWILTSALRHNRRLKEIRREEKALHPEAFANENKPAPAMDFRSRRTLLGIPLIHIRGGTPVGEKSRPAIGWIAIGDRAYGILLAMGGFAIGGISLGGASIGIISMGGASFGLLAIGGLAVGGLALGGAAIGLVAIGGLATAWIGADGGLAIAHHFAIGGEAMARHANDSVAREFFDRFSWVDLRRTPQRNVVTTLVWLPLIVAALIWGLISKQKKIHGRSTSE